MPEITDLKAGSVPTEEELLGLLAAAEALLPLTFEPHNGFGALAPDGTPYPLGYLTAEQPIFGLDVFLEYNPAELNSLAALIVAAVNRLPSLIAAKAQAEAKVKELETQAPKCCEDCNHEVEAMQDRAEAAEERAQAAETNATHAVNLLADRSAELDNERQARQAAEAENARLRDLAQPVVDCWGVGSLNITAMTEHVLALGSALQQKGGG